MGDSDSATTRFLQTLHRTNLDLMEISEGTIFSLPLLKGSLKGKWLDEEQIENGFRQCFKEHKVDEKVDALRNVDSDRSQNSDLTVKESLAEKKGFMEKEVERIKEKQALLESAISDSLSRLELSQIPAIKQSNI